MHRAKVRNLAPLDHFVREVGDDVAKRWWFMCGWDRTSRNGQYTAGADPLHVIDWVYNLFDQVLVGCLPDGGKNRRVLICYSTGELSFGYLPSTAGAPPC
jgi:hypothetical protein